MNGSDILNLVPAEIFSDELAGVFSVIDGASVPALRDMLYQEEPEHVCLFPGDLEPDMAEVAPYLVRLERNAPFTDWVVGEGWGKHWGIFAVGPPDLRTMRQHFRKLLIVHDTEGNPLRFRYYDPRVLRVFLPTCTADELGIVFGPVTRYLMEGERPDTMLSFRLAAGSLKLAEKRLAKGG